MSTTNNISDDNTKISSDGESESVSSAVLLAIIRGNAMASKEAQVSPESAPSPEPSVDVVAIVAQSTASNSEVGFSLDELLKLTIKDVVLGDESVYMVGRSKNEFSRLKSIGPFQIKSINVDDLRKWTAKNGITVKQKTKLALVNAIIEHKGNECFRPKPPPKGASTSTTTGYFNKLRLINALVDPSVPNLIQWKGALAAKDMTEKKQVGEDTLKRVVELYNDPEKCNAPLKDGEWSSSKHDFDAFVNKLNFSLTKKVTKIQEMDAKMKELAREYNKAFQKWKANTTNRSGHNDEPDESFEDANANTPWLVYCHSVASKNDALKKIVRRELEEGVGGSSTDPLKAAKTPPKKKRKTNKVNIQDAMDQELLENSKKSRESMEDMQRTYKQETLWNQKITLEKETTAQKAKLRQVLEDKGKPGRKKTTEFLDKVAKKLADDSIELTQGTDTTEFSAAKKLVSWEKKLKKVNDQLEELEDK